MLMLTLGFFSFARPLNFNFCNLVIVVDFDRSGRNEPTEQCQQQNNYGYHNNERNRISDIVQAVRAAGVRVLRRGKLRSVCGDG